MIKYEARITKIGPLVSEFVDQNILVFFGSDAPEELAEFSVLHDGKVLKRPIVPGDAIFLGDLRYAVLAVGEVANTNLANLGHLIVKFNDAKIPEMPGDVCVEAKPISALEPGLVLRIEDAE
jgi:PTS system glucitol/sorbitol-specific IIA component